MRIVGVLMLAFLAASCSGSRQSESELLALTHATLIDGTGSGPRPDITIVITDGRISEVFADSEQDIPEEAEILDLAGHYVIPGLIDSHIHLNSLFRRGGVASALQELERLLYSGVTSAREMVTSREVAEEVLELAQAGDILAPEVYSAAKFAGPRHDEASERFFHDPPWFQVLTPASDVADAVRAVSETSAHAIKVYADLDAEVTAEIVEEAHSHGLMVWAHATVRPAKPSSLVQAGVDVLSHGCMLHGEDPSRAIWLTSGDQSPGSAPSAPIDLSGPWFTSLFGEMARRGTVLDFNALVNVRQGCSDQRNVAIAQAALEAGVKISTGTDFQTDFAEPYPGLHDEIEYLVRNGVMTPLEAITAATLNGAHAAGIADSHGTVEVGKVANLVVLEEDPSADISALRSVQRTIMHGEIFERSEYVAPQSVPLSD